ncbi:exonuclease V, chloroplastic [Dorcoceras hygrometricum]|uniref:Exonuclease V, chloroplastic n=1 Tax=Dorcoceras hygrometricum TaxID=472368 RepID=A0A2Z7BKI5_9LAMI|nr:exonuclease V, chloroplastic [Dorcoceras hygrometricum]
MALIKATIAAASMSALFHRSSRPFRVPVTLSPRRTLCMGSGCPHDVKYSASFLYPNRRPSFGLSVTDLTDSDWCEKQKEFSLVDRSRKTSAAMKTGDGGQEEVIKRYRIRSAEDSWAIKFTNSIIHANELLVHGLTRELTIVGFTEGAWIVGRIDEVRLLKMKSEYFLMIVEKKTRRRATLPTEPQRRKGRFQVMCYKKLMDISAEFPSEKFYDHLALNPEHILSPNIVKKTVKSGFPCETLRDLVECFRTTCSLLPPTHDKLLLRYELQGNLSLLLEKQFPYDPEWVTGKIKYHLEFLSGKREAACTPVEERWKCNFCRFSSKCPAYSDSPEQTGH